MGNSDNLFIATFAAIVNGVLAIFVFGPETTALIQSISILCIVLITVVAAWIIASSSVFRDMYGTIREPLYILLLIFYLLSGVAVMLLHYEYNVSTGSLVFVTIVSITIGLCLLLNNKNGNTLPT